MFDTSVLFLIQNIILLTLIFWLLSFVGVKFFKKKTYRSSNELFECGFLSTHNLRLSFNYNFLISATLLILYDVEFLLLLPVIFNFSTAHLIIFFPFFAFIIFIVASFVYDWEMVTMDWTV